MKTKVVTLGLAAVLLLAVVLVNNQLPVVELSKSEVGVDSAPQLENQVTAFTIASHWDSNKERIDQSFEQALGQCSFQEAIAPQQQLIQPESTSVIALADDLVRDAETDIEKTFALFDYVAGTMDYTVYPDWRDATEVSYSDSGDCTDKSILLVSMLTHLGIESYVVYSEDADSDYSHAWVAARVDGAWVQFDPTVDAYNFVYDCIDDDCEYTKYYNEITGMFNADTFRECNAS